MSSWPLGCGRRTGAGVGVSAEGTRELSTGVRSPEDESCSHTVTKTEGARVVEAGVMSPVEGAWSDPTRRVGPYPSHSKATEESSDSGQQSQSIAWARWSGEMSNSSQ